MEKQTYNSFDWQPKVIATLPKGEDAEKLYEAYQRELKKFPITDWGKLEFDKNSKEIHNPNNIDQGVINHLLRNSGIRVAVPGEDIHGDILRLIKYKPYQTYFNANVVQKKYPSYEKNKGLWRKIIELAEETNENIKYPFMIQGFYNLPSKIEKDYGIKIVPASNFRIIEDDRLSGKYNEWEFDNVDATGLPVGLSKRPVTRTFAGVTRTFYTRDDGLSSVYLGAWVT